MNILHIVGSLSDGGAALGARALHEELLKLGINSKILYLKDLNKSISKGCINSGSFFESLASFFWQRVENKFLAIIFSQKSPVIFTTGLISWSFKKYIKYHNIDLINVHWPGYGAFSFSLFSKLNVVFTMRDMWLATAGCHIPMDCKNFMNECSNCPVLTKKRSFLSNYITKFLFLRKKKWIQNTKKLEIVAISKFVGSYKSSPILKTKKIHIINNFVDLDQIKNTPQKFKWFTSTILEKPKVLIPKETSEIWKGYNDLKLNLLELNEIFEFAQFGRGIANPNIKDFGFINSRHELYSLYKSATVFLFPSRFESFGKVIIESAAVGTPVVVQQGAKIGIDKSLPFMFEANFSNLTDLISKIKLASLAKKENKLRGNKWFELCNKLYSPSTQAKKYIELYEKVIK